MIWKVIVPPSTRDESMVHDWAEQPGARDPGDILRGYNILSLATPCQPGRIGPELPVARQFLFEQLPPSLSYVYGGDKARARPGHIQTSKHPSCALNVLAPRSYASTPPSLLPLFPVRCQLNPKGPVWRAGAYSPSKSPPTGISGGLTPGTVLVQGTESGELHFPSC